MKRIPRSAMVVVSLAFLGAAAISWRTRDWLPLLFVGGLGVGLFAVIALVHHPRIKGFEKFGRDEEDETCE